MAAKVNSAANNTATANVHARKALLTKLPATNTAATPHPVSGLAIGKLTAARVKSIGAARHVIGLLSTLSAIVRFVSASSRATR
jgi:hypothetical protein